MDGHCCSSQGKGFSWPHCYYHYYWMNSKAKATAVNRRMLSSFLKWFLAIMSEYGSPSGLFIQSFIYRCKFCFRFCQVWHIKCVCCLMFFDHLSSWVCFYLSVLHVSSWRIICSSFVFCIGVLCFFPLLSVFFLLYWIICTFSGLASFCIIIWLEVHNYDVFKLAHPFFCNLNFLPVP